jgi:hypothetical protein
MLATSNIKKCYPMMKTTTCWLLGALIAIGAVLSCAKETEPEGSPKSNSHHFDNGIRLAYTVTTHKYVRPADPEALNQMARSEQSVMIPEITQAEVSFEMDTSGNFFGVIQMQPPEELYPANTIGRRVLPDELKVARTVFNNSGITYYNAAGETIEASPFCSQIAGYYQLLASNVQERLTVSPDHFALLMAGWREAGFQIEDVGERMHVVEVARSGGGKTQLAIDNQLQAIVGSAHFDAAGNLLTASSLSVEGSIAEPTRLSHRFMTPARAPLSDVPIEILYDSIIENITML